MRLFSCERSIAQNCIMPTVSLVVPCYNIYSFLSATLESVRSQDFGDWEIILVDDGSEDDTWSIISRFMALDSRIRGLRKSNEGTASARNYGFSKASSTSAYIFFLDHDDQLEPNALTRLTRYMDTHPEVGLLACQYQDISADGRRLGTGHRSRWAPGAILPHEMQGNEIDTPFEVFFCGTGQGPFALYRRSIYAQTEGWETAFWPHEDSDMFCQMALLAKVHFLPDQLYLKRIHAAQGMNDGARVQRAYTAFRAKWDKRAPRNNHEEDLFRKARRYYYATHGPCRDLKVARKAFAEFFSDQRRPTFKWGIKLVVSALYRMLFYRIRRP